METTNLIAYQLRKLTAEGADLQQMEQALRRLLETERQAHLEPQIKPAVLKLVQ